MIIGLHGLKGVGKDTVGNIIQALAWPKNYQIKKFATKLKQIAGILLGVDPSEFENRKFKESELGPEWDYWTVDLDGITSNLRFGKREEAEAWAEFSVTGSMKDLYGNPLFEKCITHHVMTVRQFLQELGTEATRDVIHPHIWLNGLLQDYKEEENWIVTDVRFQDEVDTIHNLGGKVYWVDDGLGQEEKRHKSETIIPLSSLDGWIKNYVQGMEPLKQRIEGMIARGELIV